MNLLRAYPKKNASLRQIALFLNQKQVKPTMDKIIKTNAYLIHYSPTKEVHRNMTQKMTDTAILFLLS
jgi:hypothetical protein